MAGGRKGAARSGTRPDLGRYFRSSWEANYARYLNVLLAEGLITSWEYEPKTFAFPVTRGNTHYTPDFKVFYDNGDYIWHEVKGYMDDNSRVKLKRFAKFYPEEKLLLVDRVMYREIESVYKPTIENWE